MMCAEVFSNQLKKQETSDVIVDLIYHIEQMAQDAEKISAYDKQLTIIKLLENWLARYSLSEAWRHELPGSSESHCLTIFEDTL